MPEIAGKKIGMTQIFTEEGKRYAVTVIEAEPLQGEGAKLEEVFRVGDFVDIRGVSKGKGFQGGMKRWNWSGTPQSHGSMSHRRVGSIGASADPSRVLKGTHMPGHMGNRRITIQNLQIVKLDNEQNLIAIKGAVPGSRNTIIEVTKL